MQARRRGRGFGGLAAVALLLAGIGSAAAQDAAYGTAAAEIAEKISAAFPKVTGQVIGIEQERILLDLGAKDQVIPGLELQVYREGQEFKHPFTGQVLGKLDRDVGRVRVLEVQPNFCVTEMIQQAEGTTVQQGDHVRVTSARVILALPNVDVTDVAGANTRSVTRDLLNALVKTGRFEIMTDQRVRAALIEEKMAVPDQFSDPAVLQALWKRLRVTAVLLAKLSLMEKAVQLNVQALSTVRGDSITLASAEVKGVASKFASSGRGSGSFAGGEASPRIDQVALRSQDVPYQGTAMAVGEFTGDGTMKLAVSDGQGVYIYDLEKAGIKLIWSTPGSGSDDIIALDAADINKNGVAEIYVTNFSKSGLRSYVLEYRDGKFIKIWDDVPLAFRILEGPDGAPQLYAQTNGVDKPFDGPVRKYTWQGTRYVPGEVVPLPNAFNVIYGFSVADLDGDGSSKVLVLDQQDHLRVFDRAGTEIYRSSDRYGGLEVSLEYNPERAQENTVSGIQRKRLMLQGRMYYQDIMGDGKKQVVVFRNTPSTGYFFQTRLYDKGKIFGLTWDGAAMQPVWETREMAGYVADYALVDPDGSGSKKLVVLIVPTNLVGIGKSRSNVILLDLRVPG